jgi:DNA ligase (NAD+)
MVEAIALKTLYNNGEIVGYQLQDNTGKIMNIKSEAIIDAMRKNLINITNLYITNDNKLVMKENNKVNISSTEANTAEKHVSVEKQVEVNSNKSTNNADLDRLHYLVDVLNKAAKVYEQGKDEIMSNFEYDKLYDELVELENKTGTVLANSPTMNVGYEVVSNLPKEKHSQPMLSLEKTKSREELASFLNGHEGVLSWKMDGLTVVLTYEDGKLVKGVTRGNGEIGEVVTPNVKHFKNVPRQIAFKGRLVLRGEAIIRYSTFEKINNSITSDDEKYKNPRNLCSGSVRQLDSSITAQRGVEWYCFDVVECVGGNIHNNVDEQFDYIKMLGFDTVQHVVVNQSNIMKAIEKFEEAIKTYDIPSDGLVLTFRDKQYGLSLGRTAKAPRHSKAFKWQDENAQTTVTGVEWSVGKSGVITPVIEFEPVDIEGSTVTRASSHNVSIFLDMEYGIGDRIEVFKANMIIPQVSANLTRTGTCEIPGTCPCCGAPTEIHEDPRSGVYTLWCMNPDCDAKGNRLFKHFVSRDAMNIDGISGATLETLADAGLITDFASIYHLREHSKEIVNMSGFGYQSFVNMVNAIEKSREVKLANLIYAFGISNIGLATAKLICKHFNNSVVDTVGASYTELVNIEGIGDVIAQSFVDYFEDKDNADSFVRLLKELKVVKEEISTNTEMNGVTICVTGDVYIFPNRRVIKDLVENLGGKLTGSVSKSTSYLVTNDTESGSNKNKAAKQYGIPILTEQEFIDKFNLQKYI